MSMESYKDELGSDIELLEAKTANARKAVEQAEANLANADEDNKELWENRVSQRRAELEGLEKELEEMSSGV